MHLDNRDQILRERYRPPPPGILELIRTSTSRTKGQSSPIPEEVRRAVDDAHTEHVALDDHIITGRMVPRPRAVGRARGLVIGRKRVDEPAPS